MSKPIYAVGTAQGESAESVSILLGREELAPALRNDRPLLNFAFVGQHVLQADLAALRALGKPLVMGVRLLDLVGFLDLLIGHRTRGGAACDQNANRQASALEQRTAR